MFGLEDHSDREAEYLAKFYPKKLPFTDHHYMPIIKLKAVLLAADGKNNREIADALEISQHTIGKWRTEFLYYLSRVDLPFDRIPGYFLYSREYWLIRADGSRM
jgi:hypothetical protein